MQIFKNRPLALSLFVFAMTAVFSYKLSERAKLLALVCLLLLALVGIVVSIVRKKIGKYVAIFILCSFFASVAIFQSWFHFQLLTKPFREKEGQTVSAEGFVIDALSSVGGKSRFAVQLRELDGAHSDAKILLECTYHSSLHQGDSFRMVGKVRAPENTPSYPEETILLSDGYLGILLCEDYKNCTISMKRRLR